MSENVDANREMDSPTEPVSTGSPFSISSSWSLHLDTDQFTFDGFEGMLEVEPVLGHELSHMLESTPASSNWVDTAKLDRSIEHRRATIDELDDKGLGLVHLLMAASEFIGDGDVEGKDLAWVILARLKELAPSSEGTNSERLATHFRRGLQHVLQGTPGSNPVVPKAHEVAYASLLFQEMLPCIRFGQFTANQAIIEAVRYERGVHIIDYDIVDGMQWAPLIQALAPSLRLRITALNWAHTKHRPCVSVSDTGRRLTRFARSIGRTFSFHQCRLGSNGQFEPSKMKLVKGEALMVNCMLHSPNHPPRGSVGSVLSGALTMNPRPKVVTLVEDQAGSHGDGFVEQFMNLLNHYSAIYDSMDQATRPGRGSVRKWVESDLLGPTIESSLAQSFANRHGGFRGPWFDRMEGFGLEGQPISTFNHSQAKLLLEPFPEGYTIESHKHRLMLLWKGTPLLAASVWSPGTGFI